MSEERLSYVGFHNPIGSYPAFCIPAFLKGNQVFFQLVLPSDQIYDFMETPDFIEISPDNTPEYRGVGELALHCFGFNALDRVLGTREQVRQQLSARLDEIPTSDRPGLALEVAEFLQNAELTTAALIDVYNLLRRNSEKDAVAWRDRVLLPGRIRRALGQLFGDIVVRRSIAESLNNLGVRVVDRRVDPLLPDNLYERLGTDSALTRALWRPLQLYLDVFNLTEGTARRLSSIDGPVEQHRTAEFEERPYWALAPASAVGERIIDRLSRDPIFRSRILPNPDKELRFDQVKEAKNVLIERQGDLLLVFDESTKSQERAITIASAFAPVRCHAIMVYRVAAGIPAAILDLAAGPIGSLTVVPTNDIPMEGGVTVVRPVRIVRALLELLWSSKKPFYDIAQTATFSFGAARTGRKHQILEALENAVAVGANPWLPLSEATQISAVINSVAKPMSHLELQSYLSAAAETRLESRSVDVQWSRRSFYPGASQAAYFGILAAIQPADELPASRLAAQAGMILRLGGYQIERRADDLFIASAKPHIEFYYSTTPTVIDLDIPRVIIVDSQKEQIRSLRGSSQRNLYPLTLADLYYLRHAADIRWTLEYLVHLAVPNDSQGDSSALARFLHETIGPSLLAEFDLSIEYVTPTIRTLKRLSARRVNLMLDVTRNTSEAPGSPETEARLQAVIGPRGLLSSARLRPDYD
jgi:hypothetical protein